jgi:hypothetical protein
MSETTAAHFQVIGFTSPVFSTDLKN